MRILILRKPTAFKQFDFLSKKSACVSRPDVKYANSSSATTESIKYFSFGKLGYGASEWFTCMRDEGRRNFCYGCGEIGHTFMQCEKKIDHCVVVLMQTKRLTRLDVL